MVFNAQHRAVIDTFYPAYLEKKQCWIKVVKEDSYEERYCMKPAHVERIRADTGERVYLMLAGHVVDEKGEENGSHAASGLAGAFILEEGKVIVSDDAIPVGSWGQAPTDWKLVKLAPTDYYGWETATGDCHFGHCGSRNVILAPYGKGVRNVTGFATDYSNAGNCGDGVCPVTELSTEMSFDTTRKDVQIYPIKITLNGQLEDKKLEEITYTLPFDKKGWRYVAPKDWPLGEVEF